MNSISLRDFLHETLKHGDLHSPEISDFERSRYGILGERDSVVLDYITDQARKICVRQNRSTNEWFGITVKGLLAALLRQYVLDQKHWPDNQRISCRTAALFVLIQYLSVLDRNEHRQLVINQLTDVTFLCKQYGMSESEAQLISENIRIDDKWHSIMLNLGVDLLTEAVKQAAERDQSYDPQVTPEQYSRRASRSEAERATVQDSHVVYIQNYHVTHSHIYPELRQPSPLTYADIEWQIQREMEQYHVLRLAESLQTQDTEVSSDQMVVQETYMSKSQKLLRAITVILQDIQNLGFFALGLLTLPWHIGLFVRNLLRDKMRTQKYEGWGFDVIFGFGYIILSVFSLYTGASIRFILMMFVSLYLTEMYFKRVYDLIR